ncbi:unnamed protein product [Chrysoparadoxa australica]
MGELHRTHDLARAAIISNVGGEREIGFFEGTIFRLRFGVRKSKFLRVVMGNPPLRQFMKQKNYSEPDAARLLSAFCKIDSGGRGYIDLYDLFNHCDVEFSEYNKRVFRCMAFKSDPTQRIRDDQMRFDEFLVSTYNYLTMSHDTLVRLAFDANAEGKQYMTNEDLLRFSRLMFSNADRAKETAVNLVNALNPSGSRQISFEAFLSREKRLSSMLYPAFTLQKVLRKGICKAWFWHKITLRKRRAVKGARGVDLIHDFIDIQRDYLEGHPDLLGAISPPNSRDDPATGAGAEAGGEGAKRASVKRGSLGEQQIATEKRGSLSRKSKQADSSRAGAAGVEESAHRSPSEKERRDSLRDGTGEDKDAAAYAPKASVSPEYSPTQHLTHRRRSSATSMKRTSLIATRSDADPLDEARSRRKQARNSISSSRHRVAAEMEAAAAVTGTADSLSAARRRSSTQNKVAAVEAGQNAVGDWAAHTAIHGEKRASMELQAKRASLRDKRASSEAANQGQ